MRIAGEEVPEYLMAQRADRIKITADLNDAIALKSQDRERVGKERGKGETISA
jgi:hypothetical protein